MTNTDSFVVRKGKVFHVGEFADKNFAVSADELRAAAERFVAVPVDLEHHSTVLDNHLGQLRSVALSDDGQTLIGEYEEPTWLGQLLQSAERKVSLTWDRAAKTITGMALTLNPRIPDATLFAAFAAATAKTPTEPVNAPYTVFTDEGKPEPGSASLDSRGGVSHNQNNPEEKTHMSTTAGGTAADTKPQEIAPSNWERLKAFLGLSDEQVTAAKAEFSVEKTPREIALEQENARLKKESEDRKKAEFSAQATARTAQAKAMAEALVRDLRILPAEAEAVTAEFSRALDDDALTPNPVIFNVPAEQGESPKAVAMSRADRLGALYRLKPQHNLTNEVVREFPPESYAMFARETTQARGAQSAEFNQVDADEMLQYTEAGRHILAERRAQSNGSDTATR